MAVAMLASLVVVLVLGLWIPGHSIGSYTAPRQLSEVGGDSARSAAGRRGAGAELERTGGRLMMLFVARTRTMRESCPRSFVRQLDHRLTARLNGDSYPAVTPRLPAAHWFEREIHDLWGVVPEGHPRLEPLIRHRRRRRGWRPRNRMTMRN